jgi:predicted DNA binding CopG/RHH family protein
MRRVPRLRTDEEAEAFLDQDLSDLDFSQFKAGQLEYERKDARLTMRLPQPMLDAVKRQARARGIPYQRLVREAIEKALATAGQE